jgi:hypothetical protein
MLMWLSAGRLEFASVRAACASTAYCTASTALPKSARTLSPAVLANRLTSVRSDTVRAPMPLMGTSVVRCPVARQQWTSAIAAKAMSRPSDTCLVCVVPKSGPLTMTSGRPHARLGPCSFSPIICDLLPIRTVCGPEDLLARTQSICCGAALDRGADFNGSNSNERKPRDVVAG